MVVILAMAAYKGYSKGIIRTVLSVLVWLFGWVIAVRLSSGLSSRLGDSLGDSKLVPIVAFLIVFVAVGFGVRLLGRVMEKSLGAVMLGWSNRLGGALIYFFGGVLICSGFLWLLSSLDILRDQREQSTLESYLSPVAPYFAEHAGAVIPVLQDSYHNIQSLIDHTLPPAGDDIPD